MNEDRMNIDWHKKRIDHNYSNVQVTCLAQCHPQAHVLSHVAVPMTQPLTIIQEMCCRKYLTGELHSKTAFGNNKYTF